jgi:hypothetical protein
MLAAKWQAWAVDLKRLVRHHQSLATVASQRGHADAAERHLRAVDSLLRGAPRRAPGQNSEARRGSHVSDHRRAPAQETP